MAKNISKNSRMNVAIEKFHCSCGGEVKMVTTAMGGKIKHSAKCGSCGTEIRRPSDFR